MTDGPAPLRVLLVEDSAEDTELVLRALRAGGLSIEPRVVATEAEFGPCLSWAPDVIISDWKLPGFSGAAALAIAHESAPNVPCILISGTLGDDLVVAALRHDAVGYVPKGRLEALVPAVQQALAHAAAHRERDRLRSVVEESIDGIVIAGPDWRILYFNQAFADDVGRVRGDLRGQALPPILTEILGAAVADMPGKAASGTRWIEEVAVEALGGDGLRFQLAVTPRLGADRTVADYVVILRDVTEREQARLERDRLATVVEQADDGIVVSDPDGCILYANPAFSSGVGAGRGDPRGQMLPALVTGLLGSGVVSAIDRRIKSGRRWLSETVLTRPDGAVRHIQVVVTPRRDAAAVISSDVTIFRDVTDLREAEAELALEARVRAVVADGLRSLSNDAGVAESAQAICDGLVKLPHIDVAAVWVVLAPDDVRFVAISKPPGYPTEAGDHMPPAMAAFLVEAMAKGPRAVDIRDYKADDAWKTALIAAGLKTLAAGPIEHGGDLVGAVAIGTFDEDYARRLVEDTPTVVTVSASASAALAERLHEMRRQAELRGALEAVLHLRAFHPVFQPIVDLESRKVVGYEALTRFDSGRRPDLCFAEAWSVGLGPDLELVTLGAATAASGRLPAGLWLSLNVSPRLLADPERLSAVLWPTDRPIVLEITEHEIIEDYGAVLAAVRALGHNVRIAVDDAGAGVANFGHIVELRPSLVKLDIGLVRNVNVDLGRQAMVVGMRHFAAEAGCRLLAEGVETKEEAETMLGLGVDLGQGYLFGRPEPVDVWAAGRTPAARRAAARRGAPDRRSRSPGQDGVDSGPKIRLRPAVSSAGEPGARRRR